LINLTRAQPIRLFLADTHVFQFSLPISDTDIFILLKAASILPHEAK